MKKKIVSVLLLLTLVLTACHMPVASSDTTSPVLQNAGTSAQNVFYRDSSCGPTRVTIFVDVSDDSGSLATVGLQYRYRAESNFGASLAWTDVSLPSTGNGHYAGELDVATEAESILGQGSGTLEYQVYAVDMAGNLTTSPEKNARSISVQYCNSGIASDPFTPNNNDTAPPAPPVASPSPVPMGKADGTGSSASQATNTGVPSGGYGGGSGNSNPTPEPTADNDTLIGSAEYLEIDALNVSPNVIYYGQCNNNEPISATYYLQITPYEKYASGVAKFVIYDPATGNQSGNIGDDLDHDGNGRFSFWTGEGFNAGVDSILNGKAGNLIFTAEAVSVDGLRSTTTASIYIDLLPCTVTTPTVPPVVTPTINYFTGPSGAVEPNSSYTIEWDAADALCPLLLDGVEVDKTGSKTVQAPFVVGSDTVIHTLMYSGNCLNQASTYKELFVIVEEANSAPTIVSGGLELGHWDSIDVDYAGGVDITFVQASGKGQFYGENGTVLAEWPHGNSGDPGADNCRLEAGARGSGTFDIYSYNVHDYVCYITGSGNAGSLNISYMVLQDDPSDAKIMITYKTAVLP